ncbi:MAG: hypothetical protein OXR64_09840 [Chloroflexota bacterium]|nr:hypothetical protein [Chloroflexota bacterium]MDE2920133.1 hypothetical protein [Chloroflexota bacterium]
MTNTDQPSLYRFDVLLEKPTGLSSLRIMANNHNWDATWHYFDRDGEEVARVLVSKVVAIQRTKIKPS